MIKSPEKYDRIFMSSFFEKNDLKLNIYTKSKLKHWYEDHFIKITFETIITALNYFEMTRDKLMVVAIQN